MDYSQTLNLPKTEFPMRASLPQREPEILNKWLTEDLYGKLMEHNDKPFDICFGNAKWIEKGDGTLYDLTAKWFKHMESMSKDVNVGRVGDLYIATNNNVGDRFEELVR